MASISASAVAYYVHLDCAVYLRRAAGVGVGVGVGSTASSSALSTDGAGAARDPPTFPPSQTDIALAGLAALAPGIAAAAPPPPRPSTASLKSTSAQAWRQAVLDRGNDFESELLAVLAAEDGAVVVDGDGAPDPREVLADAVARAEKNEVLVYHWQVPAGWADTLWPLGGGVRWKRLEADLLRCTWDAALGRVRITVVDIKASHALKLYHQVQVAIYAEALARVLASDPALAARAVLDDHGEVWRPDAPRDIFPLALFRERTCALLATTVPDLLRAATDDDAGWTMLARCQQCGYAADCQARTSAASARPTLNRLAALPAADVAWLRAQLGGSNDIEDIAANVPMLLARDAPRTRRVLALQPQQQQHSAVVDAARSGRPVLRGRPALTLPRHEDVAIVLTAVADPRTGHLVAYGVRAPPGPAAASLDTVVVFGATDFEDADRAVAQHIATLVRTLSRPPFATATVQLYVYDHTERERLLDAVLAAILVPQRTTSDADLEASALTLVDGDAAGIQLAAPPTVDASGAADVGTVGCPRIQALAPAIQALYVVPTPGFFTLDDALAHFGVTTGSPDVTDALAALSLGGSPPVPVNEADIYSAWQAVQAAARQQRLPASSATGHAQPLALVTPARTLDLEAEVRTRVRARLDAIAALLDRVRTTAIATAGRTLGWTPERLLPLVARPLHAALPISLAHPALRKLAFLQTFDLAEQARQLWQDRLQRTGPCIVLRALSDGWWTVVSGAEFVASDADQQLGNWLLFALPATPAAASADGSDATEEAYTAAPGVLADARFRDLANCDQHVDRCAGWLSTRGQWLCDLEEERWTDAAGGVLQVRLAWPKTSRVPKPASGALFAMRPRLVDFNTPKVTACLAILDAATARSTHAQASNAGPVTGPAIPAFVQLLEAPQTLSEAVPDVGGGPLRADGAPTPIGSVLALYEDRELRALASTPAAAAAGAALAMSPNQREVFEWVRTHGLAVVWGPPGTGKTTFLAGALVRLLHVAYAAQRRLAIFVTAFTKTAIENLMERVRALVAAAAAAFPPAARELGLTPASGWLLDLARDLIPLTSDSQLTAVKGALRAAGDRYIVFGTCWQLHKYRAKLAADPLAAKLAFDVVVIDEASQLGVPAAAVALQSAVGRGGRIVLAGDPMQLQPILKTRFPIARDGPAGARLDGSVLQSVLRNSHTGRPLDLADLLAANATTTATANARPAAGALLPPYLFMLRTTYRCNGPLTQLAQRIYGLQFRSDERARDRRLPLLAAPRRSAMAASPLHTAMTAAIRSPADQRRSMITVRLSAAATAALQQAPYGAQIAAEAQIVGSVYAWLADNYRPPAAADGAGAGTHGAGAGARAAGAQGAGAGATAAPIGIFVATPHRAQRVAVRRAIEARRDEADGPAAAMPAVVVDTVERLQGKEADVVVAAYLFVDPLRLGQEAGFVFNLQRLNVTFTRARMLCVLVVGDAVCDPPLAVLGAAEMRPALDLVHAFVAASHIIEVGL